MKKIQIILLFVKYFNNILFLLFNNYVKGGLLIFLSLIEKMELRINIQHKSSFNCEKINVVELLIRHYH